MLGAVLASRVADLTTAGLTRWGSTPAPRAAAAVWTCRDAGPGRGVIRAAYGDATGRIFLIAAGVAVITLIAVAFLPNKQLRTTIDLKPEADHVELEPARV